jgi:hypothetical protein
MAINITLLETIKVKSKFGIKKAVSVLQLYKSMKHQLRILNSLTKLLCFHVVWMVLLMLMIQSSIKSLENSHLIQIVNLTAYKWMNQAT